MHDASGRLGSLFTDELFQGPPLEELHRVVEHAAGCPPVVVDGHGIRMRQLARYLNLALEAREVLRAHPLRQEKLHGGRAP